MLFCSLQPICDQEQTLILFGSCQSSKAIVYFILRTWCFLFRTQLVESHPKMTSHSFWYGTCTLAVHKLFCQILGTFWRCYLTPKTKVPRSCIKSLLELKIELPFANLAWVNRCYILYLQGSFNIVYDDDVAIFIF
jgi:hypothetical protein